MGIRYLDESPTQATTGRIRYVDDTPMPASENRPRTAAEYVLPSFMTKYQEKPGERTLTGDIFERPGAAVRSALMGKGYSAGAITPEKVPSFQETALKKYYERPGVVPTKATTQLGGLGVSAAGLAADIATNPADMLTMLAPKAPGAGAVTKVIAETKPARAIGRFMEKERHMLKTAPEIEKEAVDIYRQILRPTQGEVKTIEIRKKGSVRDPLTIAKRSVRDPLTIAAEEQLPIGLSKEGGVNKIDTVAARQKIASRIDEIDASLTETLKTSKTEKKFIDLKQNASEAKRLARASTPNDTVYKSIASDIDEYTNDAIAARARYVSAADLNEIKRGMYSVGYNAMKPTSDKAARFIGRAARMKIEKAFPDENISRVNKILGDYITLQRLLEGAQGRVVAGGRIGKYLAQGIGAAVGAAAGSPIPYVGPVAGALIGRTAGAKIAERAVSPLRLSAIAGKKALKAGMAGRALKEAVTGEITPMAAARRGLLRSPAGINRLLAVLAERSSSGNGRR